MKAHLSINTDETCMALDCHFSGNPFMEVDISDEFMGEYANIDLTLEQVKELYNYLTDVLKQAGEL